VQTSMEGQGPCNLHRRTRAEANRCQTAFDPVSRSTDYSTNRHTVPDRCQMHFGAHRMVRGLTTGFWSGVSFLGSSVRMPPEKHHAVRDMFRTWLVVNETLRYAGLTVWWVNGRSFGPWCLLISSVGPRCCRNHAAALDIRFLHTLSFVVSYSVTLFQTQTST
jgi:hypothetical protein